MLVAIAIALMLPVSVFAYSVSGGGRGYSIPTRTYTPSYHPSYSPPRVYTPAPAPVPTRVVTPPKTYTGPDGRTYKPVQPPPPKEPLVGMESHTYSAPAPVIVNHYQYYNPVSSDWFLWYWLFARPQNTITKETTIVIATSTYATSTTNHQRH